MSNYVEFDYCDEPQEFSYSSIYKLINDNAFEHIGFEAVNANNFQNNVYYSQIFLIEKIENKYYKYLNYNYEEIVQKLRRTIVYTTNILKTKVDRNDLYHDDVDAYNVGRGLFLIQDFYLNTNYVKLYRKIYNHKYGKPPITVPTIKESLKIRGVKNLLKKNLKYNKNRMNYVSLPCEYFEYIKIGEGELTNYDYNNIINNSNSIPLEVLALKVATLHTFQILINVYKSTFESKKSYMLNDVYIRNKDKVLSNNDYEYLHRNWYD